MPEEINKTNSDIASDDLAGLLQANLARSEEILKISQEIKNYIKWQNIWIILRFVIIVVPIVLGFIYLPPLIKDALQSYRSLLGQ